MQNELLVAILAGLGGMLGWGFTDFFAKKTIDKIGDVTTLFWGQLFGLVPLSLLFFLVRPSIPQKILDFWPYVIVLGAWTGLAYIPVYIAFGKGKISLISSIQSTYAVIVILVSAIFFHEAISLYRQIDFLIIFIGILFIKIDLQDLLCLCTGNKNEKEEIKGLKEILFATVLYAVWIIAVDRFINGEYWLPYLFIIHVISVIFIYLYSIFKKISLRFTDKSLYGVLFIIGFCDIIAFSSFYYGLSKTSYTSIVVMLSSAFSLPTIILARVFLKEKITTTQTVAIIVIIAGVMALAFL